MTEPNTPKLTFAEKLLKLYERFAYVHKGGTNDHFSYKFMQESELKRRFNLACRELGLLVARTEIEPVGEPTGKACVVILRMTIVNADPVMGGQVVLEGIGGGMDSGDKAPMKAVVSAYKYALANGLSIQTGDDPEVSAGDAEREADLMSRIQECGDLADLRSLREEVLTFKGSRGFAAMKQALVDAKTRIEAARPQA